MHPTPQQLDRAVGAVVGSAIGDALGAPYEFGPAHPDDFVAQFGPGMGGEAPGGWTDDTAMAMAILDALAAGLDIDTEAGMQHVIERWYRWVDEDARGIGIQTAQVLRAAEPGRTERDLLAASQSAHRRTGRSGGNGSLMRIGPLALGYLDRDGEAALPSAAERVTRVTHWEPDNVAATTIWSLLIRRAILTGDVDAPGAVEAIDDAELRARWSGFIQEARAAHHPRDFSDGNGWVVRALQAALIALEGAADFRDAIQRAVRGGEDTDTVAAIAGALAGAKWGVSQIPLSWQRRIHGWPGWDANDLARHALLAVGHGRSDRRGWPAGASAADPAFRRTPAVRHPHDAGLWLGSQSALAALPASVSAVVSLSRVGTREVPDGIESIRVWLVDEPGQNAGVERTLADAADMVAELRREGREVFLHCAEARSRTAAVAALYAARHLGIPLQVAWSALDGRRGDGALPDYDPARFLVDAVTRIVATGED